MLTSTTKLLRSGIVELLLPAKLVAVLGRPHLALEGLTALHVWLHALHVHVLHGHRTDPSKRGLRPELLLRLLRLLHALQCVRL